VKLVKYMTGINYICESYQKLNEEMDKQATLMKEINTDKSLKISNSIKENETQTSLLKR